MLVRNTYWLVRNTYWLVRNTYKVVDSQYRLARFFTADEALLDAKVPAAKRVHTALCHCGRARQFTQTTNFRDRPRAAPGMGFRGL
jgi:hypothetical protein